MPTDPSQNSQTWGLTVPYHWRDYASWRLISELCRRHPEHFAVTERAYMGGQPTTVWHLSEGDLSRSIEGQVLINNTGSVTISNHSANCPPSHRDPFAERYATLDVMFTDDLEALVRTVETCAGLERKSETPATCEQTIAPRVIAEMLGQNLHSRVHLRIKGFLYDNSRPRFDWSDQFKGLHHHKLQDYNTYELQESWGQVFFVFEERDVRVEETEPDTPILALEVSTGLTYTRTGEISLLGLYDGQRRDISRTAFELLNISRRDA